MKRNFLSALIGVGMLAAIFPVFSGSGAARTQQSYPLICRGSANLAIGIAPGDGNIGFVFTRGTKPANQGLAPGECSWVDRGMYANEPDKLSQHVANGIQSLSGNLAPENRWYEELHSPDRYWTFMVYNDRQGQMIVTGARPNEEMSVYPPARVPDEIKPTQTPTPDLSEFRPSDDLTISTPGVYSEDRNLYLALPITNTGTTPVLRVQIESISGSPGPVKLLTPASLPAVL